MTLLNTKFTPPYSLLLLTGVLLVFLLSSCDNLPSTSGSEEPIVPTMGDTPLPGIAGLEYKTAAPKNGDQIQTGVAGTGHASSIDWAKIKAVLNQARQQTGSRYAAFYSVSDSSRGKYYYATAGLTFSKKAMREADNKIQAYLFESKDRPSLPTQLLVAYIPDSRQAENEMQKWILSKAEGMPVVENTKLNKIKSSAATNSDEDECYHIFKFVNEKGEITAVKIRNIDCLNVYGEEPEDSNLPDPTPDPIGEDPEDPPSSGDIPCSQQVIPTGGCPPGPGGSGPLGDENNNTSAANAWEDQIDDAELEPCMQSVMADLKDDYTGVMNSEVLGVGEIVQKFAGEAPGYNWKMKDGDLPEHKNATTETQYNTQTGTVTTIFDTDKFDDASNLSVARTILHEAIHAYVVTLFHTTERSSGEREAILGENWVQAMFGGDGGHKYISDNFRGQIASSLNLFAAMNGQFDLPSQFFEDMAWGGLVKQPKRDSQGNIIKDNDGKVIYEDTAWFKDKETNDSDRERIKNTILIELTGQDTNGYYEDQKGKDAGC